VAAVALGRRAFAAETDPAFADLAVERLQRARQSPRQSDGQPTAGAAS
jgi:hypothetical protein